MNIILLGAGRVGLVSAVCYVQMGHIVTLMDIDDKKINQIQAGTAPFLEEGLEELLIKSLSSGSLHVTSKLEGCFNAEAFLLCLPTPSYDSGETDLSYIREAFVSIRPLMESSEKPPFIIIRSTVPPPAIRLMFEECFISKGIRTHLVLNPEFLREGSAIDDFFHPPFCVAGGDDPAAVQRTLALYESIVCQKYAVSLESAGLLKYACNVFHTMKISFANEIGRLAGKMGADASEVMRILASDTKLNASSAYLRPGFAFGGPCLGKDLSSLLHTARQWGIRLPLLENILPSNEAHLQSCVDAIVDTGMKQIGLIGVSFKRGTGDLRSSPYMELARLLEEHSVAVRFYDAEVSEFAHTQSFGELLDSSDAVAMTKNSLTQRDQEQLVASKVPILDLERVSFL